MQIRKLELAVEVGGIKTVFESDKGMVMVYENEGYQKDASEDPEDDLGPGRPAVYGTATTQGHGEACRATEKDHDTEPIHGAKLV